MTTKKQTPAAPAQPPQQADAPWLEPQTGGRYRRDPVTGVLTADAPAAPAASTANQPEPTQE